MIQDTGAERFLFVAEKQGDTWIARRKTIKLGENYANQVEILDGLEAGDFVITLGFQTLADGQSVFVQQGE